MQNKAIVFSVGLGKALAGFCQVSLIILRE